MLHFAALHLGKEGIDPILIHKIVEVFAKACIDSGREHGGIGVEAHGQF